MDVYKEMRNVKNSDTARDRYQHIGLTELLAELSHLRLSKNERKVLFYYERLIFEAFEDQVKYFSVRWQRLTDTFKIIKKNNLYYALLSLTSKILRKLSPHVYTPLDYIATEMCDTLDLVGLKEGTFIAGLGHNGKSLIMMDRPFFQEFIFQLRTKNFFDKHSVRLRKEEVDILNMGSDTLDIDMRYSDGIAQRIAFLVSDKNIRVYPKEWGRMSALLLGSDSSLGFQNSAKKSTFKKKLLDRKYVLNRRGINLRFPKYFPLDNLFLMEAVDKSNNLYLFAKFKVLGMRGEFTIAYEVRKGSFIWGLKIKDNIKIVDVIERIILESYTILTCELDDIETGRNLFLPVSESETLNRTFLDYTKIVPMLVEVHSDPVPGEVKSKSSSTPKSEHARIYTTRRLPSGWNRSARAEDLASLYKVKLKDGETFVSGALVNVRDKISEAKNMELFGGRNK